MTKHSDLNADLLKAAIDARLWIASACGALGYNKFLRGRALDDLDAAIGRAKHAQADWASQHGAMSAKKKRTAAHCHKCGRDIDREDRETWDERCPADPSGSHNE